MLFAFVIGFASTYSCGGGGSSASAGGDADTLEGLPASAFALSAHNHSEYATTGMLASHTHSEYALTGHGHDSAGITGSIDADTLEGVTGTHFAERLHNHAPGAIVNQGDGGGLDSDLLDGLDSTDFSRDYHVHRLVLLREGYAPGNTPNLQQGTQYYWSAPMPPEFLDGGLLTIEALFFENSPVAAGDVVLSWGFDGINDGGTVNITPSLTPVSGSEQLFTMNGNTTVTAFKATWGPWPIADVDFLQIGLLRGDQGALTDTFGSEISILGFQVTYTN
jgi:hypothetical protein